MITLDLEPELLLTFRAANSDRDLSARLGKLRARIVMQLGTLLTSRVERAVGNDPRTESEASLFRAIVAGDTAAFDTVFVRYAQRLTRYAERSLGPADADEVVQQTFLQLFEGAKALSADGKLESFLFSLLRTRIVRELSRRARSRTVPISNLATPDELEVEVADDPALALFATEERETLVRALIEELDDLQREIVIARFQEIPHAEIASRFDLEVGHVRVQLHRAVEKLKRRLGAAP